MTGQVIWMPMSVPVALPTQQAVPAVLVAAGAGSCSQPAAAAGAVFGGGDACGAVGGADGLGRLREAAGGRQLFNEAMTSSTFDAQGVAAPGAAASAGSTATAVDNLPSLGSQLHGTGKCSPCAWFWKQKGCQNARNCHYCHLCPEGELKSRKKAKVTAIRMGALEPATYHPGMAAAPATLKLTTLLQDA